MSDDNGPRRVSLPGINELFPEILLQNLPPRNSPIPHHSSIAQYRQDPRHDMLSSPPSAHSQFPQESAHDPRANAALYNAASRVYPPQSVAALNPLGQRHPQATEYPHPRMNCARAASGSHSPPLRSEIGTENANAARSPRTPHSGAFGYSNTSTSDDSFIASITKPTFRVHLPPPASLTATQPSDMIPADRRGDSRAQENRPSYPPNYMANTYLSAPSTSGTAQTLMTHQNSGSVQGQPADEKRHRCPHCSKRFNRPSSLKIHVNTHTGAKPFVCVYPGCSRKFNVNSNMRRHYRNHLAPRRSDAVSRFLQPPSPSLSASTSATSAGDSPVSSFARNLPPLTNHYSPPSRSSSPPSSSADSLSDEEDELQSPPPHRRFRRRQTLTDLSREAQGLALHHSESAARLERHRVRSRSSPARHTHAGEEAGRQRALSACNVPGCRGCTAGISTALRPAFPENRPGPSHR